MSIKKTTAWTVWALASIFYAYQYILRVMPNIMMEDILHRFEIDAATFGQFTGVYYLGYSLLHLPIGIFLDRYGPKKVMPFCIGLTVIGLLPLLFSTFWVYPLLGRACIGIGSSAAILGTFKIIRLAFKEEQFTRMLSFSVTFGLLGAIYGGGPVNYLLNTLGYEKVIWTFVLMGLLLALATYFLVPPIREEKAPATLLGSVREVLSNWRVIATCLSAGLMVGPLEGFADVWGAGFFKKVYHFDGQLAAFLPSLIFVGMCFGAPLLSLVAERTRSYLGTIIFAGIFMAGSFSLLVVGDPSAYLIGILFVGVGVCSAYQILAIYQASTYVKEQVVGLTTASANMIIMIFGYVFHSVIGGVIQRFGGAESSEAFNLGVSIIPVGLVVGIVGFCGLAYFGKRTVQVNTKAV